VELSGRRQHSVLDLVPKRNSGGSQGFNDLVGLFTEGLLLEHVFDNRSVDAFDRKRQDHIENEELSLETIGNIVSTTTRVVHGTNVLQVLHLSHDTTLSLVKHVETTGFNELTDDF
jgi:hypothetical protein